MPRKLYSAFISVFVLLALTAQFVSAHATLIKADPAPNSLIQLPPSQVILTFDEPIDLAFSTVEVYDQTQARFDSTRASNTPGDPKQIGVALKAMPDGTYTVAWKALSAADGHLTRGNYAFSVGKVTANIATTTESAAGETAPVSVVARWVELLSILALVGAILFRETVLTYSLRAVGAEALGEAQWKQLVTSALGLAIAAELLRLALQANLVTDSLSAQSISQVLFHSRYGILWLARATLVGALAWFIFRSTSKHRSIPLILGILSLLTLSLGGHSAALGDFSFLLIADWLHLSAVSFWVGGLVSLVWLVATVGRALSSTPRFTPPSGNLPDEARAGMRVSASDFGNNLLREWLGILIPRFSFIALISVGVILITGLYASVQQIPSLNALVQTLYGESLAVKVILFLVMVALGAYHLTVTSKRIAAPSILRDFRALVAFEVAIGALAIALAGFMTLSIPARATVLAAQYLQSPSAKPTGLLLFARPSADIQLTLNALVDGNVPQKFDALLLDASKQPAKNVLRVIYEFTLLDQDIGVTRVNVDTGAQGHYTTSGNYLTFPGLWRVRVIVRRAGVDDIAVDLPIYRAGPNPTTNDFKALELLQQADAAMNRLKSLRTMEELNDGENGVVVTRAEFAAPDRLHTQVEGGNESTVIGSTQYYRDASGWTSVTRSEPYKFPLFNNAGLASGIKLGRGEVLDGKPAQIVMVDFSSSAGDVHYAYWVGTDDRLIRQYAMVAPGHFMMERYRDFNAAVEIDAPKNIAPAAAPSAATRSSAPAAPSPRISGPITGDLQSDLALGILVVALLIGLRATDRERAFSARIGSVELAGVLAVAALLLFNDAINATYKQFANAPIDPKQAASGQTMYEQNCIACHGETGYGNGTAAASLKTKPFDLTVHAFQHDEAYFVTVMRDGRGEMPAFKGKLTTQEMLNLVQYMRQLARDAQATQ